MLVFQPSSSIHSFIHTKCRLPQLPHCSAQLYLVLLIKAILPHLCFPRLWLLGSDPCLWVSTRCFKANCSESAPTAWICPSRSPLSFCCCCEVNPYMSPLTKAQQARWRRLDRDQWGRARLIIGDERNMSERSWESGDNTGINRHSDWMIDLKLWTVSLMAMQLFGL